MKLLLVVEDEYGNAEVLRILLEDNGYRVILAANGKEALELLSGGERPALILSDFMMPHLNGAELGEAVRSDAKLRDIPFVIMSGTNPEVVKKAFRHYDAFLAKPYDTDHLLNILDDLVSNGRPEKKVGASEKPAEDFLRGLGMPPADSSE